MLCTYVCTVRMSCTYVVHAVYVCYVMYAIYACSEGNCVCVRYVCMYVCMYVHFVGMYINSVVFDMYA